MESSGTTLNVFGVTQDTSAILFPIHVAVKGSLDIINTSSTNQTSLNTVYDVSANTYTLGLTFADTSGVVAGGTGSGGSSTLPIVINGVTYYIALWNAR